MVATNQKKPATKQEKTNIEQNRKEARKKKKKRFTFRS